MTSAVLAILLVPPVMLAALFLAGFPVSATVFVGLLAMVLPWAVPVGVAVSHINRLSTWAAVAACFAGTLASAIAVACFIIF